MTDTLQIADDIPMPVLLFSADGFELEWVNLPGQSWLGSSLKKLRGRPIGELFSDVEAVEMAIQKVSATSMAVQLSDFVVQRRGKDEEKCHVSAFAHEGKIGLCFHLIGRQTLTDDVFRDGSSALGRLLAHEIKNPLAGIRGAAQLLRADVETEEANSLLDLIDTEIDRVSRLADRMERLGDSKSGEFTPVNVHEILRHARRVIQSGSDENIIFTEVYDPSLPLVSADMDSLTQAVLNLIKNASEVPVDDGRELIIKLETLYRPMGQLPVEIRISDNGNGIPQHIRDRIFQPFITSKPQGQGLGLALVSKVIAAHSGAVEVTSRTGETIFSILLPQSRESASEV